MGLSCTLGVAPWLVDVFPQLCNCHKAYIADLNSNPIIKKRTGVHFSGEWDAKHFFWLTVKTGFILVVVEILNWLE